VAVARLEGIEVGLATQSPLKAGARALRSTGGVELTLFG
jgi:hypothetical protein